MSTAATHSRPGPASTGRATRVAARLVFAAMLALVAAPGARADQGDCGQPLSTGSGPTATDCGYVLKVAVGTSPCDMCVCDINGSASTTSSDALACLKSAVGQGVPLSCPPCVTTTTIDPGSEPSTTSTSTTSTTTTIPVRCSGNSDCSALGAPFRCNPNTETCEKPCTRNRDCHLFYECSKTTGYCQEPALLF